MHCKPIYEYSPIMGIVHLHDALIPAPPIPFVDWTYYPHFMMYFASGTHLLAYVSRKGTGEDVVIGGMHTLGRMSDAGPIVPHIGWGVVWNPLLPFTILFGSSNCCWGASSVTVHCHATIGGNSKCDIACSPFNESNLSIHLACGNPCTLPIDLAFTWGTTYVHFSMGDLLQCLLDIAIQIACELLLKGVFAVGKSAFSYLSKLGGKAVADEVGAEAGKEAAKEIGADVGKEVAEDVADDAGDDAAKSAIKESLSDASASITETSRRAAQDAADDALDDLSVGGREASESLVEVEYEAADASEEAADAGIKDAVRSALKSAGDQLGEAADAVSAFGRRAAVDFEDMVTSMKATMRELGESASETIDEMGAAVKKFGKTVASTLGDAWDATVQGIKDFAKGCKALYKRKLAFEAASLESGTTKDAYLYAASSKGYKYVGKAADRAYSWSTAGGNKDSADQSHLDWAGSRWYSGGNRFNWIQHH